MSTIEMTTAVETFDAAMFCAYEFATGKTQTQIREASQEFLTYSRAHWADKGVEYLRIHICGERLEHCAREVSESEGAWLTHYLRQNFVSTSAAPADCTVTIHNAARLLRPHGLIVRDISGGSSFGYLFGVFAENCPGDQPVSTSQTVSVGGGSGSRFCEAELRAIIILMAEARQKMPVICYCDAD